MKKFLFLTLFFTFLLLPSATFAFQGEIVDHDILSDDPNLFGTTQPVSDEIVEVIQQNRNNFFPISIYKSSFTDQVDAVLSDAGKNSVMRVVTEYGEQSIDLFVNADHINDHIGKVYFDGEYRKNFEISADITTRDVFPLSEGGCYLGFTDNGMPTDTEAADILFVYNGIDVVLYVKKIGYEAGVLVPLKPLPDEPRNFALVHLTGYTFVFVNDVCVGQYPDNKTGPFRLFYGAVTFPDGDTAACSFDNLEIKKLGSE